MLDKFRDLILLAESIGEVESSHMYDYNYCSVEGVDREGRKFSLSLSFKNEEVKEND
jgi:hypothetical protein